jgi:membrane protease YdiL (CAAX protease family)
MFLIVVLALVFGRPFAELDGSGWTQAELLKTVALVFGIDVVLNAIWISLAPKRPLSKGWSDMVSNGWGFLIFVVVLFGPLLEEVIFRYLLVGSLHDVSPFLAIMMSGLLFGLVHDRAVPVKIVMGSMYAWIYIESGSLWVPLLMHAFWNAGTLLLSRRSINRRMNPWKNF